MFTKVRTRIAPSPTGMMHLGTARTAIYCWAVARHFGGEFLLRIEDTDRERSTPEATQVILDAMKWLNLDYDNKEVVYQMNRLPRYKEVVDQLLAKGLAYKCYATKEELDEMREAQKAAERNLAMTAAGVLKTVSANLFPKASLRLSVSATRTTAL